MNQATAGAVLWVQPAMARELHASRVLIVGHGSIGRAVERRLQPFGVTVTRIARRPRDGVATVEQLSDLLQKADIVVILLPLTAETRGIVDQAFLRRMKQGALLVNAGRGALADTQAITDAVLQGHVRAALDVV